MWIREKNKTLLDEINNLQNDHALITKNIIESNKDNEDGDFLKTHKQQLIKLLWKDNFSDQQNNLLEIKKQLISILSETNSSIKEKTKQLTALQNKYLTTIQQVDNHQQHAFEENKDKNYLKPIPNVFPERRHHAVKRNDPLHRALLTFSREDAFFTINYQYLLSASQWKINKEAYINRIKQNAIEHMQVDIEKVPLALLSKILPVPLEKNIKTQLQYFQHRWVNQIIIDINYLKEFLIHTNPYKLSPWEYTSRIQISTHPDHKGKILVYKQTKTAHSEGKKKLPYLHSSLSIFDDIYEFERSQEYALQTSQANVDSLQDKLYEIQKLFAQADIEKKLPDRQLLEAIIDQLQNKKDAHLVSLLKNYLQKLQHNKNSSQSSAILGWAKITLLKKIDELLWISSTIQKQSNDVKQSSNSSKTIRESLWNIMAQHIQDESSTYLINKDVLFKLKYVQWNKKIREWINPYELFEQQLIQSLENHWIHTAYIVWSVQSVFNETLATKDSYKKTWSMSINPSMEILQNQKQILQNMYWATLTKKIFSPLEHYISRLQMIQNLSLSDEEKLSLFDKEFDWWYIVLKNTIQIIMHIDTHALSMWQKLFRKNYM